MFCEVWDLVDVKTGGKIKTENLTEKINSEIKIQANPG